MTSELVYVWLKYHAIDEDLGYRAMDQLNKRLKSCGCTDKMIDEYIKREIEVFRNSDISLTRIPVIRYPIREGYLGVYGYPWWEDYKALFKDGIENSKSNDYTISEIISIIDRAEYLVVYEHENEAITNSLFKEIYLISETGRQKYLLQRLADQMVLTLGWSMENINKFFINEFAIINKYRYNRAVKQPFDEE